MSAVITVLASRPKRTFLIIEFLNPSKNFYQQTHSFLQEFCVLKHAMILHFCAVQITSFFVFFRSKILATFCLSLHLQDFFCLLFLTLYILAKIINHFGNLFSSIHHKKEWRIFINASKVHLFINFGNTLRYQSFCRLKPLSFTQELLKDGQESSSKTFKLFSNMPKLH